MAKELFISSTPHETKVAVVEDEQLSEIYFERENEYTLAGSIYKGRVTRVLPGMQSAFVDIGLERDAFLYVTDFLEEQEDQEEFEQVVNRAHSEAHQPRSQQLSTSAESDESDLEGSEGQEPAGKDSNGSSQSSDRAPRRWRGRRGRRRRGGFQDQNPASNLAAPDTSSEIDEAEGDAEPALLPGESLSKYRHDEGEERPPIRETADEHEDRGSLGPQTESSQEVRESRTQAPGSSSPMSVLPGESISKYRPRGASADQSSESAPPAPSRERNYGRGGSRWERPSRRPEREQRERPEAPPSGPPVFALPGESLAKYRGKESTSISAAEGQGNAHSIEAVPVTPPTVEPASQEIAHHHDAVSHVREPETHDSVLNYAEPAHSHAEERVEQVVDNAEPAYEHEATVPHGTSQFGTHESSEQPDSISAERQQGVPHEFGAGPIEEEVIEEEEADGSPLGEHFDEDIFEELVEETLDAENAEQLVEAVREAHQIQRLGLRDGESSEGDDQNDDEEVETLASDGEASDEELEASEQEDSSDQGLDAAEAAGEQPPGELEEGRAELRAPANTAPFQQRTDRQERNQQDRFRRGRGRRPMRGRRNIQRESQPTISELLKEGQEILVQIAKEPMAKKGARITSHIALPGRFLVYMPTVNHVGVSRKIGSDEERQRLKRVLINEKGNAHGGFIVRTAAAGASEEDLRSDLRFLINLWTDIKTRSENSKAPALIYHDLNLVERILRDQVTSNFTGIWMDSEQEYERIVRFLGRFQPSMVRRAKLYTKDTPLFEQFGIQEEINNALKSRVWLKSGGYIVINQTEALVAIDINTGKYVGKTQRLEDTIVKTNIDAIKEIVRQIRLRDLGGIIVIDFIDMDERRNRQKVMQALEEELKHDRAPSKVLQFNDFGLVAITRKRVKQSLERTLSTSCVYCSGTGMIKSVQTVCNEIYVEMRKMSRNLERHDVLLRVNPEVVKALKANNARWLQEMEELAGKTIIVKSDPLLHQEQFDLN